MDKIQKDKIQMLKKSKKTKYKCDKTQKDRLQIWQNTKTQMRQYTKRQNTNTSWGWAEPSSAEAGAMDSDEIRLKIGLN